MSIPQNRSTHQSTHQAHEAFRETVRRITEEIQNNHRPGYGVQIPQSLLETDLPSMAIAIRNVGRFAVVLDPATAASGDGPSHQSPETTSQSASASASGGNRRSHQLPVSPPSPYAVLRRGDAGSRARRPDSRR